ncbi:DUF4431 domain-containing protein [Legionella erythra]|uniref:DUF4431 domain-containing protein n=1 Tax=Legionella erythra TaxID=448 RepID=A0A0W0TUV4_LEGER|nr:DUF4431 domain-containing protein [Legionella erythra]KTC99375.1 hypothetical protein Lery_0276 [Legionella erythra]
MDRMFYLLLSLFSFSAFATSDPCIVAGQETQLSGTIHIETFAGLPDYESIQKGDTPETYWILITDKPYCGQGEDFNNPGQMIMEKNQSRFQLVLTPEQYQQWKGLLQNKLVVKGSMFMAHTGHHHTPLLIEVTNIMAVK